MAIPCSSTVLCTAQQHVLGHVMALALAASQPFTAQQEQLYSCTSFSSSLAASAAYHIISLAQGIGLQLT